MRAIRPRHGATAKERESGGGGMGRMGKREGGRMRERERGRMDGEELAEDTTAMSDHSGDVQ